MKIVNETAYNTADLRALCAFLCKYHHCRDDKVIRIVYSRRYGTIGGHAPLGYVGVDRKHGGEAQWMTLTLPGPKWLWPGPREASVAHFAQVFEHELAHNRGLMHGDMEPGLRYCKQPAPFGIESFQLRRECPQPAVHATCGGKGCPACYTTGVASVVRPATPAALPAQMTKAEVKDVKRSIAAHVREAAKVARSEQAHKREERTRAALAKAESRLKRLQARIAKLRAKVNYYDRRNAPKGA